MGAAKATLGYPSRTAAVLALRGQGLDDVEIAGRIGIRRETVAALAISHERGRARRPAEAHGHTVLIPDDILNGLRPHAEVRGISVNELARRIIDTVVDERLVDAVLDDRGNG
jgi:transcriptional regulator